MSDVDSRGLGKDWHNKRVRIVSTPSQIQRMLTDVVNLHHVHVATGMCECGHPAGTTPPEWMRHTTFAQTEALLRLAIEEPT